MTPEITSHDCIWELWVLVSQFCKLGWVFWGFVPQNGPEKAGQQMHVCSWFNPASERWRSSSPPLLEAGQSACTGTNAAYCIHCKRRKDIPHEQTSLCVFFFILNEQKCNQLTSSGTCCTESCVWEWSCCCWQGHKWHRGQGPEPHSSLHFQHSGPSQTVEGLATWYRKK